MNHQISEWYSKSQCIVKLEPVINDYANQNMNGISVQPLKTENLVTSTLEMTNTYISGIYIYFTNIGSLECNKRRKSIKSGRNSTRRRI